MRRLPITPLACSGTPGLALRATHSPTMTNVPARRPAAQVRIAEANDGPEYLFISFDIDVLDPAFVPGAGTPEPGGLTPREAFPLVRRLCAESNVVGF